MFDEFLKGWFCQWQNEESTFTSRAFCITNEEKVFAKDIDSSLTVLMRL